jgi:hypothetical protein
MFHDNFRQFAETSTTSSRDDWGRRIKDVALDLFEEVTQYGVFRGWTRSRLSRHGKNSKLRS